MGCSSVFLPDAAEKSRGNGKALLEMVGIGGNVRCHTSTAQLHFHVLLSNVMAADYVL